MTVREAAVQLEVTPALVYKLCRHGRLAHRRIGLGRGAIRIMPDDLAAYLESARVEARTTTAVEATAARQRRPIVPDILGAELRRREVARQVKS